MGEKRKGGREQEEADSILFSLQFAPSKAALFMSIPNEILTLIAKEAASPNNNNSSLASLSLVSPRFVEIVLPILLKDVRVFGSCEGKVNNAKVQSLLNLVRFQDRTDNVESFGIVDEFQDFTPLLQGPRLHTIIQSFQRITTLAIPIYLVTNLLLDVVYRHPTVVDLEISGFDGELSPLFDPTKPLVHQPRPAGPLVLRNLDGIVRGGQRDSVRIFQNFVDCVATTGILVPCVVGRFQSSVLEQPSVGPFTQRTPHLSLQTLGCELEDTSFEGAYMWIHNVVEWQSSLSSLFIVLANRRTKTPFVLSHGILHWPTGETASVRDVGQAPSYHWRSLSVYIVRAEYHRQHPEDSSSNFEVQKLELTFGPDRVVLPDHIWTFVTDSSHAESLQSLHFVRGRWSSDWTLTASYLHHLPKLTSITFTGSLTRSPTLNLRLTCPTCVSSLETTHPSQFKDAELVGGHTTIFKILFWINLHRFDVLGTQLRVGTQARLVVQDRKGTRPVLEFNARRGKTLWGGEGFEGGELKIKGRRSQDSLCFGCGETEVDPIEALMECGREEVRVALVSAGFDLAAFDARTASPDASSFETFLRE